MKMVKGLLLGSAAGLVAVGGAQAADLPVKAKPVEYVKVCSLYGAGFYYIPGTDVCMHLGGYVRMEWGYGFGDNLTNGPWVSSSMQNTRVNGARDIVWRQRAYITEETRQQTAYGTLRTYLNVGLSGNNSADFSANRAFIQIGGFTVGLASSYFDHYSVAAIAYLVDQSSDTGDGGQRVAAYTFQFGNGFSASLSVEDPEPKRAGVWNTSVVSGTTATAFISGPTMGIAGTAQPIYDQRKSIAPDIVGNLRVDGAWGSAQVMAAAHESSGGYYGNTTTGAAPFGYPSDTWGWAVGAGLRINLPMIGPGDYVAAQAGYTEGAVRYISNTQAGSNQADFNGGDGLGYGLWSDGVYCGQNGLVGPAGAGGAPGRPTGATTGAIFASGASTACPFTSTAVQLTTAWGIAGGWEHFWTPSLRTSIHGNYIAVRYNSTANSILCGAQSAGSFGANTLDFSASGATGLSTCHENWQTWQIGSRTQWNVTKDFYMGFDVVYYKLETASKGAVAYYTALAGGAQPSGLRTIGDQDALAGRVRWHRDLP
jgi:hypothetical protein